MTRAASSSWVGRIRSRLQMKVTWAPKRRNAVAYSAPVAPAPTTTRCSGTSRSLYTSWLDKMTSPSVGAVSIRRGSDPVATRMASPSSRSTTSSPVPAST